MTKPKSILTEPALITSADTDFSTCIKLSALINMHIQIAWHHAEQLGFGMDFLHENNLVWMLSRLHLRVYSYPRWNEQIELSSWPKGIRRLFYLRDFEFRNSRNEKICETTSEWLIIHIPTRRPKLYNPEHNIFSENLEKHAIRSEVPVLDSPVIEYTTFPNKVSYSDIDLNQHLTTTRYIDWIFDCFDLEFLRQYRCHELIINFVREIPYGTEVNVKRYHTGQDTFLFEFCSPDSRALFFRGQIGFKET